MSVSQVEKALIDFAVHKAGTAVVLKGEWGTGKTYIWRKVIESHCSELTRKSYSYVSLFGLNSLLDVKRSIFEKTVSSKKAASLTTKESVIENFKQLEFNHAKSWFRKLSTFGKEAKIPFVASFGGLIDSIQYSTVNDTIICLDDFERRGIGLLGRDVLGLISDLIESKDCSVILILNEGYLQPDDEFFAFSEKVFDYEITYEPTLAEVAAVVFDSNNEYHKKIIDSIKKLDIKNIRLLRKIRYFAELIRPYVTGKPDEILDEATKLVPLTIYAKYSGAGRVIDIGDLEKYKGGFPLLASDQKMDLTIDQQRAEEIKRTKNNFFRQYGYVEADDFTFEIIKLIQNGYADSSSLIPLIDSISSTVNKNNQRKKIADAWHLFHHDLRISDAELLKLFETAVVESGDATSPYEIDGVYEIFIAAGLEQRGRAIVDKYFNIISVSRSIANRREMYKLPQNDYVKNKLDQYFDVVAKVSSIDELVNEFHGKAITSEIVQSLSEFTVDEYYEYFKNLGPARFMNYAQSLLALGSRAGLPESINYYEVVFFKVFEALKRMHDESRLMALRMNKFMEYQETYDYRKLTATDTVFTISN